MRADGSIKDLTTGLSTMDKSQWDGRQYMKLCSDMRNNKQDGLVRRPPADLILNTWVDELARTVDSFDPNRDVLFPFEVDFDKYWLYCQLNENGAWYDHTVHVFDEDGAPVPCDNLSPNLEYLLGVRGNRDVAICDLSDGIYVVNQQKNVRRVSGSAPITVNQSMVVVHTAPKVHQQIAITWEYPDQTHGAVQYVVGQDHPTQPVTAPEDVDNGVNSIAGFLTTAINAQITTDGQAGVLTAKTKGGTIVFERAVPDFSSVIVESGDNDLTAINGEVQNVLELPRYAHNGQIVTVAPEATSARGAFYMRSELILGDEVTFPLPAADWQFTAGEHIYGEDADLIQCGWVGTTGGGVITAYGTWDSSLDYNPVDFPGAQWTGLNLRTQFPIRKTEYTVVEVWLSGTATTPVIPPEEIQYVEIWDEGVSPPRRKIQAFVYQEVSEEARDDNGTIAPATWVWRGQSKGGVRLVDGRQHGVYMYDVAASQVDIPEVRWVEESAPDEDTVINGGTFVHALRRRGDGTFEFGDFATTHTKIASPLARRASGDDTTNPFPNFIDKKIRDIAMFQSRLCTLSDDRVAASVTNQTHDWFRGTVTQLLDTSPVNIYSTSSDATSLRYFVQHNADLLIFGPGGQFKLDGTIPFTPSTAAMPQAAAFQSEEFAKPIASGNDVFFPTTYGTSAGLSRYSLSAQIDGLAVAQPLLDQQIDMVPGRINLVDVSPNLGMLAATSNLYRNDIWMMEFDPQRGLDADAEFAWSPWSLQWGCRVISMRMSEDYLDVITVGRAGGPYGGDGGSLCGDGSAGEYACDAFKTALVDAGFDHVWPAESNYWTNVAPAYYAIPALVGGVDIPHYARNNASQETFTGDPAIPDACQTGWFLYPDNFGACGAELVYNSGVDMNPSQSIGIVSRVISMSTQGARMALQLEIGGGTGGMSCQVNMEVTQVSAAEPVFRVGQTNHAPNRKDVTFSSLGLDPLDEHAYHMDVYVDVEAQTVRAVGHIDGFPVVDHTFTPLSSGNGTTPVEFRRAKFFGGQLSQLGDPRVVSNNMYLHGEAATPGQMSLIQTGWARNVSGYQGAASRCTEHSEDTFKNWLNGSLRPRNLWLFDQGGAVPSLGNNDVISDTFGTLDLTVQGEYAQNMPQTPSPIPTSAGWVWGFGWNGVGQDTVIQNATTQALSGNGLVIGAAFGSTAGTTSPVLEAHLYDLVADPTRTTPLPYKVWVNGNRVWINDPDLGAVNTGVDVTASMNLLYLQAAPDGDVRLYVDGLLEWRGTSTARSMDEVTLVQTSGAQSGAILYAVLDDELYTDQTWTDMEIVWARSFADYEVPDCCNAAAVYNDEGHVRLYRFQMYGNRKTHKDFTANERFGDIHLDCRIRVEDVAQTITVPDNYPVFSPGLFHPDHSTDIIVVQGSGCPNPGEVVPYTRVDNVITLDEDMGGGDVYYGYYFISYVTMPDVDVRDAKGTIMTDAKLRVTDWDVTLTGHTDALVALTTAAEAGEEWNTTYPTQPWRGNVVGKRSTTLTATNVDRGTFRVQFRQEPENANLTFKSNGHIRMDLHQVEWRGTYYKSGRRF